MIQKHRITQYDFKYRLDILYDTIYNCEDYGCNSEGICRCSVIENARVDSISHESMVDFLGLNNYDPITAYCIDRLLVNYGVLNPDRYSVSTISGYYGEELGKVNFVCSPDPEAEMSMLEYMSDTKKIEYVLVKEYGYILPNLKDLSWSIVEIPRYELFFGQESYKDSIKNNPYLGDKFNPYLGDKSKLAKGIVTKEGDKYRLWDGYHRCMAWQTKNKMIPLVLGINC